MYQQGPVIILKDDLSKNRNLKTENQEAFISPSEQLLIFDSELDGSGWRRGLPCAQHTGVWGGDFGSLPGLSRGGL